VDDETRREAIKAQVDRMGGAQLDRLYQRFILTDKDLEILKLYGEGSNVREIAGVLNVAEPTVKRHLLHCRFKLNSRTTTNAVVIAIRRGLIKIEEVLDEN